MYDISKKNIRLHDDIQVLKNKETILKKRIKKRSQQTEAICSSENLQGAPVYIDCGASFVPRYATCVCTTMCLADYSLTYNNLALEDENCPRWRDRKFGINPIDDEEDEEEDDEEEE